MIKKFEDFTFDKYVNKDKKEIISKEKEEEKEPKLRKNLSKKAKKEPVELPNWSSY